MRLQFARTTAQVRVKMLYLDTPHALNDMAACKVNRKGTI
jgi:hypothetical protein